MDGQQEHIDTVEDNIQGARDKVEGGLRHIEHARDALCSMGNDWGGSSSPPPPAAAGEDVGNNLNSYERLYPSSLEQEEIFHWSMPFQTFHKDIKAVREDIFGLGSELAANMQCVSLADIQNCGGTRASSGGSVVHSLSFEDDEAYPTSN